MLATLLITRQFLQNVKEVSQPHLYRRLQHGDLSLQGLRAATHAVLRLLAQRCTPPRPGPEPRARPAEDDRQPAEEPRGEKKCLNGGCGVPEEEDEERRESDSEDESLLDCGLKLKKVSFIEKAERRGGEPSAPEDDSFLEEGSPTMVEKGMDPASVFELCEDDDESDGPSGSPLKGPAEPREPPVMLRPRRPRRAGEGHEDEDEDEDEDGRKRNRASWIDPPEEDYSAQLTQAEVESCMKKYEVRGCRGAGGSAPGMGERSRRERRAHRGCPGAAEKGGKGCETVLRGARPPVPTVPPLPAPQDTFQDYQEMFIQFGYVVLFSSAFPLAATCALINNVIEIRSDAFKLCTGLQRPFGQRVESIGQWQVSWGLVAGSLQGPSVPSCRDPNPPDSLTTPPCPGLFPLLRAVPQLPCSTPEVAASLRWRR